MLAFITQQGHAQKIDNKLVEQTTMNSLDDTSKINLVMQLANDYSYLESDFYCQQVDSAEILVSNSLKRTSDRREVLSLKRKLGALYFIRGNRCSFNDSLEQNAIYKMVLSIGKEINDNILIAQAYRGMG